MSSDVKKKGKGKKGKRYLSIIFVPHSHGDIKVFKLSADKSKLYIISILLLIVIVITGLCIFTSYTFNKNRELAATLKNLTELNTEQKNILSKNTNEIKDLKNKENTVNDKIKEFSELYKEMADSYIGKNKVSRSGDRNERTFIKDISKLKGILDSLDDKTSASSESNAFSDLAKTEEKLEEYMTSIPTLWPAEGKISSYFGARKDPFESGEGFHEGIDIAAAYGEDILASADGVVVSAGWYGGYGKAVIIDHGNGITTLYGHTSSILVKEGRHVKKGDLIARIGSTGRSTGAHLHFEVLINGKAVNPLEYLDN